MEFAVGIWNLDTSDEAIRSLRANDVTAVEPGPSFLYQEDEAALMSAVERFRAAGIRFYACHAPFGGDNDLSHPDEEKRRGAVANHVKGLAGAALAGAACMVIHPGTRVAKEEEAHGMDRLYASLETLVVAAQDADVQLALENMLPGHIGCESAAVRRIIDDFDSPYLGVCFDTGHAHVCEEGVDAAFATLREHIITFHLADNDGSRDQHSQPPYGTIDWEAFVREFCSMGFAHPITVEAPPWNRSTRRVLLREVQALFSGGWLTIPLGNRQVRAVCQRCGHYLFGDSQDPFCACG